MRNSLRTVVISLCWLYGCTDAAEDGAGLHETVAAPVSHTEAALLQAAYRLAAETAAPERGGEAVAAQPNAAEAAGEPSRDEIARLAPGALPRDPGRAPWVPVPEARVRNACGLDPALLARADRLLGVPWAVVRYGQLCHSYRAAAMSPEEALSTTKTLGGVVAGTVAYQTRSLVRHGRKTGPFSDLDRVDHWLDAFDYNRDAQISHVLGMVAPSRELTLGERVMVYDAFATYIDTLTPILNSAIRQDSARLGADIDDFTHRFLFEPLGMTQSFWGDGGPDKTFAYTWNTTVLDMARLGLLILNRGIWDGQRILDEAWIYRMTHPAFEDAHTGWGYMAWLNAASHHHFEGVPLVPANLTGAQEVPRLPGTCAPVALDVNHPHGLSDAPDCQYTSSYSCTQQYDIGVWQALGLLGQVIQGHPGLDLLIVAKNVTGLEDISGMTASARVWDALRPALVAADPVYRGDEAAFCRAYGRGDYAPALQSH